MWRYRRRASTEQSMDAMASEVGDAESKTGVIIAVGLGIAAICRRNRGLVMA